MSGYLKVIAILDDDYCYCHLTAVTTIIRASNFNAMHLSPSFSLLSCTTLLLSLYCQDHAKDRSLLRGAEDMPSGCGREFALICVCVCVSAVCTFQGWVCGVLESFELSTFIQLGIYMHPTWNLHASISLFLYIYIYMYM